MAIVTVVVEETAAEAVMEAAADAPHLAAVEAAGIKLRK
jgi:hypothetical protein